MITPTSCRRIVDRIGPWTVWTCAFAAAIALYLRAQPPMPALHARMTSEADEMRDLDAVVSQNAYAIRFGLQGSCDVLTDSMTDLVILRQRIDSDFRLAYPSPSPQLKQALIKCQAAVAAKQAAVEEFKTANAVLSNSRIYFPTASASLLTRMEGRKVDSTTLSIARALHDAVLVYTLTGSESSHTMGIAQLEAQSALEAGIPPDLRSSVRSVALHASILLNNRAALTAILSRVVGTDTARAVDLLDEAYTSLHSAQLQEAAKYRTTLFVLSVSLLAYGLWAHHLLRRTAAVLHNTNELLEHRVEERTSELALTNRSLTDSEARIRALLASLDEIVVECAEDGKVVNVWTNDISRLAYPIEMTIGRHVSELIGDEPGLAATESMKRVLESRTAEDLELLTELPTGKRWYQSRISPIFGPEGDCKSVAILTRDITEHKNMELQLAQSQKLESIGQLAAGIAHEINTPTQYIGDNTRFLQDGFQDMAGLIGAYQDLYAAACSGSITPEILESVAAADESADTEYLLAEIPKAIEQSLDGIGRVGNIVRAMKDFSHPGTTEKTSVDLNHAIETTITVARNEWKYVAEVNTDLDSSLPLVPCFPGEVNQVLLNLVVNAAHAVADSTEKDARDLGSITISTQLVDQFVVVRIKDSGTGIPAAIRDRVFDPFFTTKGVGRGTGQGLAIAHDIIVRKHEGTIHFETEDGKGTTFIIRLPLNSAMEVGDDYADCYNGADEAEGGDFKDDSMDVREPRKAA